MQYFRPGGPHFVGDCMPFFHNGRFHLFYLIDENHHQGLGGLGGHQWAHASTTDLRHWENHPLAIGITREEEGSICTGSTFFHDGVYYGFYATRRRDWTQHLSLATSRDGVHFEKFTPNPLASPPPGYSRFDFRDPFVFHGPDDRFHLLITARIEDYPLSERGGCLLRLSSDNLIDWKTEEPMLIPGGGAGYLSVPECPDHFHWNGWYYLLFGLGLHTHYRMSREPFGPWIRPANDTLDNRRNAVIKTAAFGENRRIGAGWIGCRKDDKDSESTLWGGNLILREIVQFPDGTLGTAFLKEADAIRQEPIAVNARPLTAGASIGDARIILKGEYSYEVAALSDIPRNFHLRCRVIPTRGTYSFGLGLRGRGAYEDFYPLTFSPSRQTVRLDEEPIDCVGGIGDPFDLEVIAQDDIIDVCIDGKRCLINRLGERAGDQIFLFADHGIVTFDQISLFARTM